MSQDFATGFEIQKDASVIVRSPSAIDFEGTGFTVTEDVGSTAKVTATDPYPFLRGYYLTDAGSANHINVTLPLIPTLTDWSQLKGVQLTVKIIATNTGATTFVVTVLPGTKDVLKATTDALEANNLLVGKIYEFMYDGTNMQLL
jgi:hypothetical protein